MNQTDKINKYRALAVFVRGFFEAFATGILDDAYPDADRGQKTMPKYVKEAMLEYYGHVGEQFFNQMFYAVAQLTYADADEAVAKVREQCSDDAGIPEYMRVACADEAMYAAMIGEYKRNFEGLLSGSLPSVEAHIKSYQRGEGDAVAASAQVVRLLVRLVIRSYVGGLRLSEKGQHRINQVSLVRILADNLCLLVHDRAISGDFSTLDELLTYVCGGNDCFAVMSEEMNNTLADLLEK